MPGISMRWPKWWTETMEFIRTVSGTIYEDQVEIYANKQYQKYTTSSDTLQYPSGKGIVDYLNCCVPSCDTGLDEKHSSAHYVDYEKNYGFLKKHPITGEIYTVPSSRALLDPALHAANENYRYNRFLYVDALADVFEDYIVLDYSKNLDDAFTNSGPFRYDCSTHELNIDFSVVQKQHPGKMVAYMSFDLDSIVRYALDKYEPQTDFHLGTINAAHMLFIGEFNFSLAGDYANFSPYCIGASFSGATFLNNVIFQNITFKFSRINHSNPSFDTQIVDFRNTRFFGDVLFRHIRFTETTKDTALTFEDSRITGNFEIFNTDFEHASLYCFQMILGSFNQQTDLRDACATHNLSLVNVSFEDDSHIDFTDIELARGIVRLESIPSIPSADLCFSAAYKYPETSTCPDVTLLILNCEIGGTLKMSNISELSFNNSHNFSKIVEAPNWEDIDTGIWRSTHKTSYRFHTKGIGSSEINNRILLAVYNNTYTDCFPDSNKGYQLALSKVYDFAMLKENFASMGLYDTEDIAFILYMEFKPILDSALRGISKQKMKPHRLTGAIYKLLYCTGKYGISPLRVFASLIVTIFAFSVIYFAISFNRVDVSYYFGSTLVNTNSFLGQAAGAFIYSLECIVPFAAQFEPLSLTILFVSAIENFIGTFLIGYFSVAVVRKTLH